MLLRDLRTHLLKAFDVKIDRTCADSAATGQRYAGNSHPGDERTQHESRGTHSFYQLVFGFRTAQIAAADAGAMMRPTVSQLDFSAH